MERVVRGRRELGEEEEGSVKTEELQEVGESSGVVLGLLSSMTAKYTRTVGRVAHLELSFTLLAHS